MIATDPSNRVVVFLLDVPQHAEESAHGASFLTPLSLPLRSLSLSLSSPLDCPHLQVMLRTSARAATATAPHSPTRPRTLHYHSPSPLPRRQPTSSSTAPWRPGDPILFAAAPAPSSSAVASPAQVNREERCTTATTTTATASSSAARGWRAGDPIQFASSVASLPAASPPCVPPPLLSARARVLSS